MPFGKKEKKDKPAYPVQQPAYPVQQPAYPVQQQAYYPPQQVHYPHTGTFQPTVVPQQSGSVGYPQQAMAMPPQGPPPAYTPHAQSQPYAAPPIPMGTAPPHIQQGTVVVQGGFDAGARNPSSVPPPPPGYAPNAAQMAVNQGQNVVLTQRPSNWMTGGSDGGYVVW